MVSQIFTSVLISIRGCQYYAKNDAIWYLAPSTAGRQSRQCISRCQMTGPGALRLLLLLLSVLGSSQLFCVFLALLSLLIPIPSSRDRLCLSGQRLRTSFDSRDIIHVEYENVLSCSSFAFFIICYLKEITSWLMKHSSREALYHTLELKAQPDKSFGFQSIPLSQVDHVHIETEQRRKSSPLWHWWGKGS